MEPMEGWQLLSAVVAGLAAGLIGMAILRLPRSPVGPPLLAFVAAGVIWAFGDLVAEAATGMAVKHAGLILLYTGAIAMPACWWAIALRWAEQTEARLPFRSAAWRWVPFAFAGAMWLAMLTNPWHGGFLTPVIGGRNVYGPLWYAMAIPNYALIVAALCVELAVVVRVPHRQVRHQGAFLITASLVTLIGNWLYVEGVAPVNLTQVVLGASGTLLVFGMAREGLFGVLPSALRDFAIDHPDGLVAVGPDGHTRFANARAHELLAPIEISSEVPFADVLEDERLHPESVPLAEGTLGELRFCLERPEGVLFRLDAGRPRWLQMHAAPVHGTFGGTKGCGVRIIDLTAHREAELHARQLRRLDSTADLARTVSRHFRGAFALVQSNAELLLESPDHDAASERKLSRIVDAAKYGADLALQLQLYTGSIGTARVVLELSKVVQESCEMVESDLPPGVSIRLDRAPELLPVHVDAVQLHHGVFELLANAMASMARSGGEIHVWTGALHLDPGKTSLVWGADQPAGDYAYVRVSDSGGGMDPEIEERAFEPFFSTFKEAEGVGLPTVLGIARAHCAPVALENEPGRGCTITLYFPVDRGPSGPREGAGSSLA